MNDHVDGGLVDLTGGDVDSHLAPFMGTVLIVDDDRNNLHLLSRILESRGYTVCAADSGAAALRSVHASPPDLILLDIVMPGMSGLDVCARLKEDERTRDIPVLFVTALGTVEDKLDGFRVGAVDYVTKPFQVQEVLARVATHVSLHRLQQRLEQVNRELVARNDELEERNAELELAIDTIRTLSGLIPICGWCGRKIEDEHGRWVPLERYIEDHSTVTFTHGMCPDCLEKAKQEARETVYMRRLAKGDHD
ncbi:MAG TPA: response regulator [Anaerolineae bacterium]|nr:response regulator [Anaerolineae bacterium]